MPFHFFRLEYLFLPLNAFITILQPSLIRAKIGRDFWLVLKAFVFLA